MRKGCEYAARMLADGSPRKDPQKARANAERAIVAEQLWRGFDLKSGIFFAIKSDHTGPLR